MRAKKKAPKRAGAAKNKKSSDAKSLRNLPEDLAGMYKPVKKPITLRIDADILAWFQRGGRGYQTRINRALRSTMMEERKKGRA